ncbi:MAG: hypothetical protein ABI442_20340 [Gemmatimonadaceae bacterium]
MNKRQEREFTTVVATRAFLRRHKLESGPFRAVAKALDDAIERVNGLSAGTSLAAKRSFTKAIRERSDQLRLDHMIPASRRGKTIFRGDVDMENALRVPHVREKTSVILAAAEEMIKKISPHRKLFFAADFSRTFLEDMRAAAAELAAMVEAAGDHRTSQPGAFDELQKQIARGREEVRVADGLMLAWLHKQPPARRSILEREWRAAHRITARLGRPSKRSRPKPPPENGE